MDKFYNLYIVGGYVRDQILGIASDDIDYAFEFTQEFREKNPDLGPIEAYLLMNSALELEGFHIFTRTQEFFTTKARFPKGHEYEGRVADFVMCREETYPDPQSRKPLVKMGTLRDDLRRRDFTVNAIAIDSKGKYIDPFNGLGDIKYKTLRCPISADTSFEEDPLRMLRLLRFSVTKDFEMDVGCRDALYNNEAWENFKSSVSRERVREELVKMFKHDTIRAFEALVENLSENAIDIIMSDDLWFKPTLEKRR